MSWLADLKCGDPRCGCTGNPIPPDWDPTDPYAGMGLDMSGPFRRITGNPANPATGTAGNDTNGKTTFGRQS